MLTPAKYVPPSFRLSCNSSSSSSEEESSEPIEVGERAKEAADDALRELRISDNSTGPAAERSHSIDCDVVKPMVQSKVDSFFRASATPKQSKSAIDVSSSKTPKGKYVCVEVLDSSSDDDTRVPAVHLTQGVPRTYTSTYVGVSIHRPTGLWQANIKVEGKLIHIGRFKKEEEAARAYDTYSRSLNENRRLNFPRIKAEPNESVPVSAQVAAESSGNSTGKDDYASELSPGSSEIRARSSGLGDPQGADKERVGSVFPNSECSKLEEASRALGLEDADRDRAAAREDALLRAAEAIALSLHEVYQRSSFDGPTSDAVASMIRDECERASSVSYSSEGLYTSAVGENHDVAPSATHSVAAVLSSHFNPSAEDQGSQRQQGPKLRCLLAAWNSSPTAPLVLFPDKSLHSGPKEGQASCPFYLLANEILAALVTAPRGKAAELERCMIYYSGNGTGGRNSEDHLHQDGLAPPHATKVWRVLFRWLTRYGFSYNKTPVEVAVGDVSCSVSSMKVMGRTAGSAWEHFGMSDPAVGAPHLTAVANVPVSWIEGSLLRPADIATLGAACLSVAATLLGPLAHSCKRWDELRMLLPDPLTLPHALTASEATQPEVRGSSPSLDPTFLLPVALSKRLYPHQSEGVDWLSSRFKAKEGCILGDEMGLGKTIQACTLLAGLFNGGSARVALVVAPLSCLSAWREELQRTFALLDEEALEAQEQARASGWRDRRAQGRAPAGLVRVELLSSEIGLAKRLSILRAVAAEARMRRDRGGRGGRGCSVILCTYGLLSALKDADDVQKKMAPDEGMLGWDALILDEGHKIKNRSSRTAVAACAIPTSWRLLLTGTPVQNNIEELWALLYFLERPTHPGSFGEVVVKGPAMKTVGAWPAFRQRFAEPIERARHADANQSERLIGRRRAAQLRELLECRILQRSKASIKGAFAPSSAQTVCPVMPPKHEIVLWVGLSETQREVYEEYLRGSEVHAVLGGGKFSRGALAAVVHLKKVIGHVLLAGQVDGESESFDWSTAHGHGRQGREGVTLDIPYSGVDLVAGSAKLALLVALVDNLTSRNHRVLIFSQSVRMLHIIHRVLSIDEGLVSRDLRVSRIDGSVGVAERAERVRVFNEPLPKPGCSHDAPLVMLLTTGVGALGLTLTGADRVVMFDPSWNPAEDKQAVDRAHRFGQNRNVVIYRMIGAGTVEEKVYEKQVYKDGLRRTLAEDSAAAGEDEVICERDENGEEIYPAGAKSTKGDLQRYFTREELRSLFILGPQNKSEAMDRLVQAHGSTDDWACRLSDNSAMCEDLAALRGPGVRGLFIGSTPHDALYTSVADGDDDALDDLGDLADPLGFETEALEDDDGEPCEGSEGTDIDDDASGDNFVDLTTPTKPVEVERRLNVDEANDDELCGGSVGGGSDPASVHDLVDLSAPTEAHGHPPHSSPTLNSGDCGDDIIDLASPSTTQRLSGVDDESFGSVGTDVDEDVSSTTLIEEESNNGSGGNDARDSEFIEIGVHPYLEAEYDEKAIRNTLAAARKPLTHLDTESLVLWRSFFDKALQLSSAADTCESDPESSDSLRLEAVEFCLQALELADSELDLHKLMVSLLQKTRLLKE